MAIHVSKKKSTPSNKILVEEPKTSCSVYNTTFFKYLYRIRTTVFLLFLIFLWSSSTTIISGQIIHICISSRKLNNLYCLSAGTQPDFKIPIIENNGTIGADDFGQTKSTITKLSFVSPSTQTKPNQIKLNLVSRSDEDFSQSEPNVTKLSFVPPSTQTEPNQIKLKLVSQSVDSYWDSENAIKDVKELLTIHRSWMVPEWFSSQGATCVGRGIFVYDLPPKFNIDLLGECNEMVPWIDFCNYFQNRALGEPLPKLGKCWYNTHQYALEPIFHSRVLNHPCRVFNPNEAKLFYVPYYGGLDVLRWHFNNVNISDSVKDNLGQELVKWLENEDSWTRNSGKDHAFVLGKISWDFRRGGIKGWGTTFLSMEQMQNPIKLLIERHPWHVNDIGVPHPTHFHPHSDDDIISWQKKLIESYRINLVSFAGAARPNAPDNIRSLLIKHCIDSMNHDGQCKFLDCATHECDKPESVIELFLESEFCLQPTGDSPTRKSVFDSLVSGCIPVLFSPYTAYYQYPWHLPEEYGKYSIFIDEEEVRKMKVNVVETLMNVSVARRHEMRRYIVYELLPRLVYGDSTSKFHKFEDAFSVTINNLLQRVATLESII